MSSSTASLEPLRSVYPSYLTRLGWLRSRTLFSYRLTYSFDRHARNYFMATNLRLPYQIAEHTSLISVVLTFRPNFICSVGMAASSGC